MRQTIGTTWIFQLVILFTLLFAGYIALTINYSKSFKVKNEVLSLIEKNQGMTDNGVKLINNYLTQSGYKQMGTCSANDTSGTTTYGAKSLGTESINNIFEPANAGTKYYYCFAKVLSHHSYFTSRAYYKVKLFFRVDLPVLGDLYAFDVDGQTSEIDNTYDNQNLKDWKS